MYPFDLLRSGVRVEPLFGSLLSGQPYVFDFSSANPRTLEYDPADFAQFQQLVFDELQASGREWGIGVYLEERRSVLRLYPQMIEQGRVYHAGLDIVVPQGCQLFAPLDAVVYATGRESGVGNYGGYVVLQHQLADSVFYSLYGHLDSAHRVQPGAQVSAGECFAAIGSGQDSGGWFTHTHLQIVTQQAVDAGRLFHGYVTAEDLQQIESLFPSPYPLFRS